MSDITEIQGTSPYGTSAPLLRLTISQLGDHYLLENIIKLPGEYVFSIWVKAARKCTVDFTILGKVKKVEVSTKWQKVTEQVTVTDLLNKDIIIEPELNSRTYFYEGFLSEGTVNNGWLPAPEDELEHIASVRSEITQTAERIENKIASTDGKVTTLTTDLNGIRGEVKDAKENVSTLTQQANSIELSVGKVKENLANNYYDKAATEAKIKVETDRISSTVTSNLNIGGKNLLLDSDIFVFDKGNLIASYQMSENMYHSPYTCTVWGYLSANRTQFKICLNDEATVLGIAKKIPDSGTPPAYSVSFKGTNDYGSDVSMIKVYQDPPLAEDTDYTLIKYVKLEKGNIRTDWSPAPNDFVANSYFDKIVNDPKDGLVEQIKEAKSQIVQLKDSISTLVVNKDNESLMTQKGDGWEFNIREIENSLMDAANAITNNKNNIDGANRYIDTLQGQARALEEKTASIQIKLYNGQPAIILGQSDNAFKLRITNTSIDFLDGTEVVAYISNQALYITRAIIKDEIQIGDGQGWAFKQRGNGNLGLRYLDR